MAQQRQQQPANQAHQKVGIQGQYHGKDKENKLLRALTIDLLKHRGRGQLKACVDK